jgi:hypothetical protein
LYKRERFGHSEGTGQEQERTDERICERAREAREAKEVRVESGGERLIRLAGWLAGL